MCSALCFCIPHGSQGLSCKLCKCIAPVLHVLGRPLTLPGAPLQKSKAQNSVQSHLVKGVAVDAELFSPEELLGGPRRSNPPALRSGHPQQPALQQRLSEAQSQEAQPSSSWFQLPWKVGQQDEGPSSRRISGDDRGLPLHQPPVVSSIALAWTRRGLVSLYDDAFQPLT